MRNCRGVTLFLAAEFNQITRNPFEFLAIAQRGRELRNAVGEKGHAANIGNIPGAAMLTNTKDSVQANKQQQALNVNANAWAGRLRILVPLACFVFVVVADAEYTDLTYDDQALLL